MDNSSSLKCAALKFLGDKTTTTANVKSFVVPNIFGTRSNGVTPKPFVIPSLFGTKDAVDCPQKTSDESISSLTELVSTHLKTENKSTEQVTKALSELQLTQPESERLTAGIDLSVALRATGSLPTFTKGKQPVCEPFEIPFIDGDVPLSTERRKAPPRITLTYTLDIRNVLTGQVLNCKQPSKLGKVITRKYRHKRERSVSVPCSPTFTVVKRFMFTTESPDDYINSHLKRDGKLGN
ncbi:hypothetical protein D910_02030 [Dendroctonus ponderosae]